MKTLTNNEGKMVDVGESIYNELKSDFKSGVWMAIIKVDGTPHVIVLPDNF